jgi:hypothetical protein
MREAARRQNENHVWFVINTGRSAQLGGAGGSVFALLCGCCFLRVKQLETSYVCVIEVSGHSTVVILSHCSSSSLRATTFPQRHAVSE